MSAWYCAAYFNGEEFDMTVQCERFAEAEHAFEQHLWMEYELTKDVVKGWVIVDTEFMPCND